MESITPQSSSNSPLLIPTGQPSRRPSPIGQSSDRSPPLSAMTDQPLRRSPAVPSLPLRRTFSKTPPPLNPSLFKGSPLTLEVQKLKFKETKKSFSFSSPREKFQKSTYLFPKRSTNEGADDGPIQNSMQKVWINLNERILAATQAQWTLSIPYSQGLLFTELLSDSPGIKLLKAEKGGWFTVLLTQTNDKGDLLTDSDDSPSKKSNPRSASSANLNDKIHYFSSTDHPNYLNKILKISKKLLHSLRKKDKEFFIASANGYDRTFLQTALNQLYSPKYIQNILEWEKEEKGALQIFLQKKTNTDALVQKIEHLTHLSQNIHQSTTSFFHYPLSERNRMIPSLQLKSEGSHSEPAKISKKESLECAPLLQNESLQLAKLEIDSPSPTQCNSAPSNFMKEDREGLLLPDFVLSSDSVYERDNWIINRLSQHILNTQNTAMIRVLRNKEWQSLWQLWTDSLPEIAKSHQEEIQSIVMQRCRLKRTSFSLPKFLNPEQEKEGLSKEAQMHMIDLSEIVTSFYRDRPILNVQINSIPISFNIDMLDSESTNAKECLRMYLKYFLKAQHRYKKVVMEETIEALFGSQHASHDMHILPALQAATFSFAANVYFLLMSKLPTKDTFDGYLIKQCIDEKPICEFFTDSDRNTTVIRSATFNLLKNKVEMGILSTKLISSFTNKTNHWDYQIRIFFNPSKECPLAEQKGIYESLLKDKK